MDQERYFRQKFDKMKYPRVKEDSSFVPASKGDAIEVEHIIAKPKNDNVFGNCLKTDNYSSTYDYGLQRNRGEMDSVMKEEGEDELKFGDLDQILDEVDDVGDLHAANGLSSACEDYLLDGEVAEKATNFNGGPCEKSHFGNTSSESQSPGFSMASSDARGFSDSSTATIPEYECENDSVRKDIICDFHGVFRSRCRCAAPIPQDNVCPASHDSENTDKFDNDENDEVSGIFSYEDEISYPGASILGCSRERRLRKRTRRYIEEFSVPSSEQCKGRGKLPATAPRKSKPFQVRSQDESHAVRGRAKTFVPGKESHCGTHIQASSGKRRGRPKKPAAVSAFQSEDEYSAGESDEDNRVTSKRSNKYDRRKHQRMWTLSEVIKLVDGIAEHGTGRWTEIKRQLFSSSSYRTPIDLRDKWRNLLRTSRIQKQAKIGVEEKETNILRPLPKSLLQRVRDLANMYPYPKQRGSVNARKKY